MTRRRDRRRRESGGNEPKGAPEWLVTYGDLMSLLLTFFVLLVSFSSIQLSEFQKAMGSLKGALGVLPERKSLIKLHSLPRPDPLFMRTQEMQSDILEIKKYLKDSGLDDAIEIERTPEGVLVRVPNPILFDLGKADLKPSSYPVLVKLGEFAKKHSRQLRIAGHTDDLPIHTPEFPSNWELSAMRAVNVLHFLAEQVGIDESTMSCQAFAEFQPVVPNTSPENRMRNRRVELLIATGPPTPGPALIGAEDSRQRSERPSLRRFLNFGRKHQ